MFLPLLAFVFGSLLIGAAALMFLPNRAAVIDRRLEELISGRDRDEPAKLRFQRFIGLAKRIGEKAPRSPKELGSLRLRLVQAGFRRDEALTIFFGIRVMFALSLFTLFSTSIIARPNLTLALGGAGCWLCASGHGARPPRQTARAPHSLVARRHARSPRRQRRSRSRPRSGALSASVRSWRLPIRSCPTS